MDKKEKELIERYHDYLIDLSKTNNPNLKLVKPEKWDDLNPMSCQWLVLAVLSIQDEINNRCEIRSVVPDTVEEIDIKLTNEESDFPKYLYRSNDYTIFVKQEDNKYRMQMDIERDWVTDGYEYDVLMGHGFLPCTEDDFGWLKIKHEQYYDYLSWTSRNDGHGGCKGGTMDEYLRRFSDGKTYLKK